MRGKEVVSLVILSEKKRRRKKAQRGFVCQGEKKK